MKILFFILSGIILLLFLSYYLEPRLTEIKKINEKMLGQFVKISGEITEIKNIGSLTILDIKDKSGSIKVISYKSKNKLKNKLKKGMLTEIVGKVVEYRNIIEIEARKIKI